MTYVDFTLYCYDYTACLVIFDGTNAINHDFYVHSSSSPCKKMNVAQNDIFGIWLSHVLLFLGCLLKSPNDLQLIDCTSASN